MNERHTGSRLPCEQHTFFQEGLPCDGVARDHVQRKITLDTCIQVVIALSDQYLRPNGGEYPEQASIQHIRAGQRSECVMGARPESSEFLPLFLCMTPSTTSALDLFEIHILHRKSERKEEVPPCRLDVV